MTIYVAGAFALMLILIGVDPMGIVWAGGNWR